jgi:hypothetical protein
MTVIDCLENNLDLLERGCLHVRDTRYISATDGQPSSLQLVDANIGEASHC